MATTAEHGFWVASSILTTLRNIAISLLRTDELPHVCRTCRILLDHPQKLELNRLALTRRPVYYPVCPE